MTYLSADSCALFRWVGSKRRIAPRIASLIVNVRGQYIEPFCGSAAVFFALQPRRAILSDLNAELINFWQVVQSAEDPMVTQRRYAVRAANNLIRFGVNLDSYLMVRAARFDDPSQRAARFWYLQALGFNGLWRENEKGQHNVPFSFRASIDPVSLYDWDTAGEALRAARIWCGDAVGTLEHAGRGDVVYLDPPYQDTFDDYHATAWTPLHLAELIGAAFDARRRGARVIASDNDTRTTRALYKRARKIHSFKHPQSMAASAIARKPRRELLVEL